MRNRFLRSFEDAALCQTSMLDGWYDEGNFTFDKREEFRKFLVDAHKAAYVSRAGWQYLYFWKRVSSNLWRLVPTGPSLSCESDDRWFLNSRTGCCRSKRGRRRIHRLYHDEWRFAWKWILIDSPGVNIDTKLLEEHFAVKTGKLAAQKKKEKLTANVPVIWWDSIIFQMVMHSIVSILVSK